MNRKQFIKNVLIFSGGILITQPLVSCSKESFQLEELIGKSESLLKNYSKIGNNQFGYYKVDTNAFKHKIFKGKNAFIYSENQKIIGYTIKIEGIQNFNTNKKSLSKAYGESHLVYKNDFGEQHKWTKSKRKYSIEKVEKRQNLSPNTFFSESLIENKLIVF